MIDEIETETETTTETSEAFDLDTAIAAYLAERDQQEAEQRAAKERAARETFEQERAALWTYLTNALPATLIRGLGITGPEVICPYNGHDVAVPFVVDGATWHITSTSSGSQFCVTDPSPYSWHGWVGAASLQGEILSSIAAWRHEQRRAHESNEVAASPDPDADIDRKKTAKAWEPQVLATDGYRTTYLVDVDTGCGSLTQHELTVAEITTNGDVTLSQLYPGRLTAYGGDEGAPKSVVEYHLSGAQLRALWPLWQQVTAEQQSENANTAASPATDDIPF